LDTSGDLFKQRWGSDTPMRGKRAKLGLHEMWKDIRMVIGNELFTMSGKHNAAAIEQQLFLTMRDCGRMPDSLNSVFGGISAVLTGDHHRRSLIIEIEIEIVYNMYRMRRFSKKSRMRRLLSLGPPNYAIQGTYKSGLDR
jgi:hypothetical protein